MTEQENKPIEETSTEKKYSKPPLRMVPLFSQRSLLIIGIGLVVGIALSLGYWIISPSFTSDSSSQTDTGAGSWLINLLGMQPEGPYTSRINVQMVNPGSDYKSLSTLQQMGEYYAAKAQSLPFFEFLSLELAKQPITNNYTADDLNRMISVQYDYKSELPSIKIQVITPTEKEANLLAGLLPQTFNNYLVAEETKQRKKQYDSTLEEIDNLKIALYEAQSNLDKLSPNELLEKNPSYISLKSKVNALQVLLDSQAQQLAQDIGDTDINTEYNTAVEQFKAITTQLEEAENELEMADVQTVNTSIDNASSIMLEAKIRALQSELDKLMNGDATNPGLAKLIIDGDTMDEPYISVMNKVQITSDALAIAKKELEIIKTPVTSNQTTNSPEYEIARIRIDTLKTQQSTMRDKLAQLYQKMSGFEENNDREYIETIFNKTSLALTEARQELNNLESQLGYDPLSSDLDVKIAQEKVSTLNTRLETLTLQMSSLVGTTSSSPVDYLVAGNPTVPYPVLPERARARNILMMGAIVGIAVAWLVLNFKWIIHQLSALSTNKPLEDTNNKTE